MRPSGSEALDWAGSLQEEATAIAEVARSGRLDAAVPSCPGWDLARLITHVGDAHRMMRAAIVAGGPVHADWPSPRRDPDDLAAWIREGADPLAETVAALDDEEPAWNHTTFPDTGFFWRRRPVVETAVHRWDAQAAVGPPGPLPGPLAVAGLEEIVDVWAPTALGHRDGIDIGGAIALEVTGTGRRWRLRTDDGVLVAGSTADAPAEVVLSGSASDVLLVLWRRLPPDAAAVNCSGDRAVLDRWLALRAP